MRVITTLFLKCPCCQSSQYRTSHFDVSAWNPYGAKCIFCKSIMQLDSNPALYHGQKIQTPSALVSCS
ncbi:MAG: cold-shock protein [Symbiopectobacterium sp.]|uniref:cold shock small protein YmcF n=1 Tax=Symbiopectobacterium sp. TaxID=2952789 RepID=UPI0039ECD1DD